MRALLLLPILSLTLVAACGGKTEDEPGAGAAGAAGGSAGSGGAAAGSGGAAAGSGGAAAGSGGADGCHLPIATVGPYPVTFRLRNTTGGPLVLWQDCQVDHSITSCESGFAAALSTSGACTIECSDPSMGCIACGACPSQGLTLAPGEAKEVAWSGNTYTFSTKNGCGCHDTHVAPAAHYRITVPVYPETPSSGPFGPKPEPVGVVTQEFTLPAPSGLVEVPLSP